MYFTESTAMIDGVSVAVKRVNGSATLSMSQIALTWVSVNPALRISDARVTNRVSLSRLAHRFRVVGTKL